MPIGRMDDRAPRVAVHEGLVAIWGDTPDDDGVIGLALSPPAAATAALKMLKLVGEIRGDDLPAFPVSSVDVDHRILDDGEEVVRITFGADGTPLPVFLSLDQFAQVIADLGAISRQLDRMRAGKPRHDR